MVVVVVALVVVVVGGGGGEGLVGLAGLVGEALAPALTAAVVQVRLD